MDRARYAELLRRQMRSEVEFVVVGVMAGVLRRAPEDLEALAVLRATFEETRRRES